MKNLTSQMILGSFWESLTRLTLTEKSFTRSVGRTILIKMVVAAHMKPLRKRESTEQNILNGESLMGDLVFFLLFLGSCVGCTALQIKDEEARKACEPTCAPYTVRYVDAKGVCVCDLTSIKK